MSAISTVLCRAVHVDVTAVQFQRYSPTDGRPDYLIATQRLEATLHDGSRFELVIHLSEGCGCLEAGPPVLIPPVLAMEGVPA